MIELENKLIAEKRKMEHSVTNKKKSKSQELKQVCDQNQTSLYTINSLKSKQMLSVSFCCISKEYNKCMLVK